MVEIMINGDEHESEEGGPGATGRDAAGSEYSKLADIISVPGEPEAPEPDDEETGDPAAKASDVHMSSGETDDEIPYEDSAHVGVMHGDQIEREDIVNMQAEIARLTGELAAIQDEIEAAKVSAKENFELAQRKQADFVNFRTRTRAETESMRKRAVEGLVEDLLPVLDSLQKAVYSVPEKDRSSPWADGLLRTFNLFIGTLNKYHVTVISEAGVPFDPELHSAMLVVDDESQPDNTVVEVYQNGYLVADRLLRPAMVKVARNATAAKAAPEPETEADVAAEAAPVAELEMAMAAGGEDEIAAGRAADEVASEENEEVYDLDSGARVEE